MDAKLRDKFRLRLEAMARETRDDVAAMQEISFQGSGGQAAGNLSNAPMHLGDSGTEEYLNQLSTTLLSHEEQLKQQIIDALRRLDDGTFGTCESCSQTIASDRLNALPFASECIQCASKRDHTGSATNINIGRPLDPSDTLAPEGEMGESRRRGSGLFDESSDDDRMDRGRLSDSHAAGTPGGGDALGGLAGSNVGRGDPQIANLEDAMGDGTHSAENNSQIRRPRDGR